MLNHDEMDAAFSKAQKAVDSLTSIVDDSPSRRGSTNLPAATSFAENLPPEIRSKVARILRLCVPVVVRLADRNMPLREILKLSPGTILEFDRLVDDDLDLLVNNRQVGSGLAVKANEHFGLKITRVGTPAQRVASLGALPS